MWMDSRDMRSYSKKEWYKRCKGEGLPLDGAVFARGKYCTDWNMFRPRWYDLNHLHRSQATLEMRRVQVLGKWTIAWVALQAMGPGVELTFDYGDVDTAWNPEAS